MTAAAKHARDRAEYRLIRLSAPSLVDNRPKPLRPPLRREMVFAEPYAADAYRAAEAFLDRCVALAPKD